MSARPNILLITADQWRGDCVGYAGHPTVRTPNLDRLAARGTAFLRHYAQAAPCSPSRASLYTGLYQMNHRVVRNGTPLDARHDTIALAFRRLGYRPTLFGYTDQSIDPRTVGPDDPWLRTYEGVLPGFEVGLRLAENPEPWLAWLSARGIPTPANFWEIYAPVGERTGRPTNRPARYGADETETAFLADAFLGWLAARDAEPWFAHVSFLAPHPPFVAPAPFNDMFAPGEGPRFRRAGDPAGEAAVHPLVAYWLSRTRNNHFVVGAADRPVSDWLDEDFRTVRAVYYGMIAEVDRQIGRIVDALATTGADRTTVVVFTSDHGEMMGDHWTLGKFGYFDQAYHVPLIVADPAAAAGRVEAFTESVDLFPTLVERAGGILPATLDGCSLKPFLEGRPPAAWRDAVHWEYDFREVATAEAQAFFGLPLDDCSLAVHRGERLKYVHFAGLPSLLFDLAADPDELVNRAGDPDYAAARLACAEELLAWRARHLDRTLTGIELTPAGPVDASR